MVEMERPPGKIVYHRPDARWGNARGERVYGTPCGDLPSVTTVLRATGSEADKAGIERWKERVGPLEAERTRKAAADRGNRLHDALDKYLGDPFLQPCDVQPTGDSWWDSVVSFVRDIETVHLSEGAVWHPRALYAGTLDLLATIRGKLVLVDWKTASKPKRREWIGDYEIQCAAYAAAVRALFGVDLGLAAIVVALDDRPAQVFWLDQERLAAAWGNFLVRLAAFRGARG